jgi:LPS O-antigen subunit length determinant protein (WzzB/FepE family)
MSERLLTLDQAAQQLHWEGRGRSRRLKRLLFARERQTKKRIMTRLGGDRRARYRITLSALRRYCPELFKSKVQELQDNLKGFLKSIDDRIADGVAEHVTTEVEPRLQELWERDEQLAGNIQEVARRVEQLSGHVKRPSKRPPMTALDHG